MPNNKSSGELENFIIEMLPKGDFIWPFAKKYIENIPKKNREFDNSKIKKAQFFAWLATRKKPGRMGAAIGADDLTLNNKLSKDFLKWLSSQNGRTLLKCVQHFKRAGRVHFE